MNVRHVFVSFFLSSSLATELNRRLRSNHYYQLTYFTSNVSSQFLVLLLHSQVPLCQKLSDYLFPCFSVVCDIPSRYKKWFVNFIFNKNVQFHLANYESKLFHSSTLINWKNRFFTTNQTLI